MEGKPRICRSCLSWICLSCLGVETRGAVYQWPQTRGNVGSQGVSSNIAPRNLTTSLSWSWENPENKYSIGTSTNGGANIDDDGNIYVGFFATVKKFSPQGDILWQTDFGTFDAMVLMDGAVFLSIRFPGKVTAISMATGERLWTTEIADVLGEDGASVSAYKGLVFSRTGSGEQGWPGGAIEFVALNGTDGSKQWKFVTDNLMWNFAPAFTEQGLVIQDMVGGVYYVDFDGKLIWKAGYKEPFGATWTDGGVHIGQNGVVYAVHVNAPIQKVTGSWEEEATGDVTAYGLADGQKLWTIPTPMPPNSWPVTARLRPGGELLMLTAIGTQAGTVAYLHFSAFHQLPDILKYLVYLLFKSMGDWQRFIFLTRTYPAEIRAYNADTGMFRWKYTLPLWKHAACRDQENGLIDRPGPGCLPNPFGGPTVDAAGTIFFGYQDGKVYSIWDANGDDTIGPDEVSQNDLGGPFNWPNAALGKGMLVMVTCHTVHVFKDDSSSETCTSGACSR